MPERKTVPLLIGEGDDQIQVGVVDFEEWRAGDEEHVKLRIRLDVFGSEIHTLTRVVEWEPFKGYCKVRYPKE